jgi:hypothetical protein
MLCPDEDEVCQKATELGLVERPDEIVRLVLKAITTTKPIRRR